MVQALPRLAIVSYAAKTRHFKHAHSLSGGQADVLIVDLSKSLTLTGDESETADFA